MGFFQFEIINVLVSFFRFIRMLMFHGSTAIINIVIIADRH